MGRARCRSSRKVSMPSVKKRCQPRRRALPLRRRVPRCAPAAGTTARARSLSRSSAPVRILALKREAPEAVHDAFRRAGGARRIDDGREIVRRARRAAGDRRVGLDQRLPIQISAPSLAVGNAIHVTPGCRRAAASFSSVAPMKHALAPLCSRICRMDCARSDG